MLKTIYCYLLLLETELQTYTNKKGKLYPNKECWIYPKQRRRFHEVYEILIAKTPMGNKYRISELIMFEHKNIEQTQDA